MTTYSIGLIDTPYRIDAMAYRASGPSVRLAYAVLDLWSWALMCKTSVIVADRAGRKSIVWRVATVDRINLDGLRPPADARAAVRSRLRRIAAGWRTTDDDTP